MIGRERELVRGRCTAGAAGAEPAERWSLCGRRAELQVIEEALTRPGGRGVVLVGEAGVGKSRLAEEAQALAQAHGWATEWVGAASATSTIPLAAFAPLFPPTLIDRSTDRFGLLARAIQALAELGADGRLVLAIDDAHHLDPASATLVRQALSCGSIAVIATLRSGVVAPEAVTSWWKDGLLERLEVAPLSRADTDALVTSALGGAVDGMTLQRLWEASEGDVLFLREVIVDARASGDLALRDGMWHLAARHGPGARLLDLVDLRLGRLAPDEKRVVALVAFGEPLEVEIVDELAPGDCLAALERRGLVTVLAEADADGAGLRARLAHPLHAEAVRSRTPVLHARGIYADLAERLSARGVDRPQDVLRLAVWRLESGVASPPALLLDACQQARHLFDFDLAERLARAAADRSGGVAARRTVGECLIRRGRYDDAETWLAPLAREAAAEDERTRAITSRAVNLALGLDRTDEAETLLSNAEPAIGDPHLVDRIRVVRAQLAVTAGNLDTAVSAAAQVLSSPAATPGAVLAAVASAAPALALGGRTAEALALLDAHRPVVLDQEADLPDIHDSYIGCLSSVAWMTGDLVSAAAHAERHHTAGLASHSPDAVCRGAANRGRLAQARGQVRTAVAWHRHALAEVPDGDVHRLSCLCHAFLAEALAIAGNPGAGEVLARADERRRSAFRTFDGQIEMARSWVAARDVGLSAATEIAERAATDAAARGAHTVAAHLLHAAVRFGEAQRVAARLAELASCVDGAWMPCFVAHAAASAADDPDGLERVSACFEAMGATLLAAEATAQAERVLSAHALRDRARTASARASSLAAECEGARTPALLDVDAPVPLTRREREVAQLAATGLSSREIAQRLSVSTRTVEGHLYRLYSKLGVTRRDQLVARLCRAKRVPTYA